MHGQNHIKLIRISNISPG